MTAQENEKTISVEFDGALATYSDFEYHATQQSAKDYVVIKCPTAQFIYLGDVGMLGALLAIDEGRAVALITDTALRPTVERICKNLFNHRCPADQVFDETLGTLRRQVNEIKRKVEEIEDSLPAERGSDTE